jgi:hypothetical protein
MKPIYSLIEDESGRITGALVGPNAENLEVVTLNDSDVCLRSELPPRASDLCQKYGLQPSPKMAEALARALTPPVPDGA